MNSLNHVMGQPIKKEEISEILSYVSNNSLCLSKITFPSMSHSGRTCQHSVIKK